jgi:hypothetical protein
MLAAILVILSAALFCCQAEPPADAAAEKSSPSTRPASTTSATTMPASQPTASGLPSGWELAPQGTYTARQGRDDVTIVARGENPTAGYQVQLVQRPVKGYPPQYMLARKKPDGIVAQVIKPFEVTASFKATSAVKKVVVTDGAGEHEINVDVP